MNNKYIKYKTKYICLKGGNVVISDVDRKELGFVMNEIDNLILTKINDQFKCNLIDIQSIKPKTAKHKTFLDGLTKIYAENISNYEKSIENRNYEFNRIIIDNNMIKTAANNKIETFDDYVGILERNYIPVINKIGNTIINVLDELLEFIKTNQILYYDIPSYLSDIQKKQNMHQQQRIKFTDSNIECDFKTAIKNSYHQFLVKYFPSLKEQFNKLKVIISTKTQEYNDTFDKWINDIEQFIIKYNTSNDDIILYNEEFIRKITPEYNKCNFINIDEKIKKKCNEYLDKQIIKNCIEGYNTHKKDMMEKSEEISVKCITNKFLKDSNVINELPKTNELLSNEELKCIDYQQNLIPGKYKYNTLRNNIVTDCKHNILKKKFPPIPNNFKEQKYVKI